MSSLQIRQAERQDLKAIEYLLLQLEYGCSKLEVTTSMRREKTQANYEAIGFEKTSFRYIHTIAHADTIASNLNVEQTDHSKS